MGYAEDYLFEWSGAKIEWYKPEVLEETRKLLEQYYADKIKNRELQFIMELALKHIQKDPAYKVLELTFKEKWHPEYIAKYFKITEKKVPKLLDKMIKRAAIAIYGVDAIQVFGN